MHTLLSAPPRAILTKTFATPFDNAVATARTCYSSRIITDDDVRKDEKAVRLRDEIASSTYQAGHHTTLQHAHFQFAVENISRQALWSFFHAHPFYNSEQVSQRYVEVKPDHVIVPDCQNPDAQKRYESAIKRQIGAYQELLSMLHTAAEDAYFKVYPGRKKSKEDKRWQSAIKKRCQEVARYVLPIGTHAHLYHTISGLTLHRYHRLAQSYDCPLEQRLLIEAMVNEVNKQDPLFFQHIEDPLPLEQTHEALWFGKLATQQSSAQKTEQFVNEFDAALNGYTSKLIAYTPQAMQLMGQSTRHMLGLLTHELDDDAVIDLLLNPAQNRYLGESLNLATLGKLTRAMELVHFTFQKKISHCADGQAQRHRMIPGARPILWTHVVPGKPDFITPTLFEHPLAHGAKLLFEREMQQVADDIAFMVEQRVNPEVWQYLLPNAFPVRYSDTGSLLDHYHKWTSRLCYNAQEEIWHEALDEVKQVEAVYPSIGKWLLPPCSRRSCAGQTPVCPEGIRFCGVPVWKLNKKDYIRLL